MKKQSIFYLLSSLLFGIIGITGIVQASNIKTIFFNVRVSNEPSDIYFFNRRNKIDPFSDLDVRNIVRLPQAGETMSIYKQNVGEEIRKEISGNIIGEAEITVERCGTWYKSDKVYHESDINRIIAYDFIVSIKHKPKKEEVVMPEAEATTSAERTVLITQIAELLSRVKTSYLYELLAYLKGLFNIVA